MKVLYITHYPFLDGGANISLLALIDEMINKNVEVFVMVPRRKGDLIRELNKRMIRIIFYDNDLWVNDKGTFNFIDRSMFRMTNHIQCKELIEEIKQLNIDIVHTNSAVIHIGGVISSALKIPHVWHVREFVKEFYNLSYSLGERYSHRFMKKTTDVVIVISKLLESKYSGYFGSKLKLIYNGVDEKYIIEKKYKKQGDTINILISGIIHPGKGQMDGVKAVNELVLLGYKNIKLHIAGDIREYSYYKELIQFINENNIKENIVFHGFVKEIKKLREMASIELICSRNEAFGRVTIEAMLGRNLVIGANAGATAELIKDNYNGFLYEISDYRSLAVKLKKVIDDEKLYKEALENAYEYACSSFLASTNADKIYSVYCDLLKDGTHDKIS